MYFIRPFYSIYNSCPSSDIPYGIFYLRWPDAWDHLLLTLTRLHALSIGFSLAKSAPSLRVTVKWNLP